MTFCKLKFMFFGKEVRGILNGTINIKVLKWRLKSDPVRFWYRNMEVASYETNIIQISGFDTKEFFLRISVFNF